MVLSREDRDPGVTLQSPPWSQASPRGEAKDSTLFSSRDRYLLEPTERSLLCRRALVFISLYISEHRHSVLNNFCFPFLCLEVTSELEYSVDLQESSATIQFPALNDASR